MAKFHIGNKRCTRQALHVIVAPTESRPEATISLQPSNHSRVMDPSVEKKHERHGVLRPMNVASGQRGGLVHTVRR